MEGVADPRTLIPPRTKSRRAQAAVEQGIKAFFGGNALVAVIVLALITIFLFREGFGFFGQNLANLRLYRQAGLEYVDIIRAVSDQARSALAQAERDPAARSSRHGKTAGPARRDQRRARALRSIRHRFQRHRGEFARPRFRSDRTGERAEGTAFRAGRIIGATLAARAQRRPGRAAAKIVVPEVDRAAALAGLHAGCRDFRVGQRRDDGEALQPSRRRRRRCRIPPGRRRSNNGNRGPANTSPDCRRLRKNCGPGRPTTPIPWYRSISSFLFGRDWVTASFWQDWYGIIPLLVGSVLVSLVALFFAVPLGVAVGHLCE